MTTPSALRENWLNAKATAGAAYAAHLSASRQASSSLSGTLSCAAWSARTEWKAADSAADQAFLSYQGALAAAASNSQDLK